MTLTLPAWLHQLGQILEPWFPLLTFIGLLMAVISTLAIPWLILRMPADYFTTERRPARYRHPGHWVVWVLRNTLALILLVAGILMLVLPGQGLLTMLIAIMLSTFPGKYRLERAIIRQYGVFRAVNWIRRRRGREPLLYPPQHPE